MVYFVRYGISIELLLIYSLFMFEFKSKYFISKCQILGYWFNHTHLTHTIVHTALIHTQISYAVYINIYIQLYKVSQVQSYNILPLHNNVHNERSSIIFIYKKHIASDLKDNRNKVSDWNCHSVLKE